MKRNEKILVKEKTALLVIDIQEKILDVMAHKERVLENTEKLIRGMKILGVPIYHTVQYPKGLGDTAQPLKEILPGEAIDKITFSASGAPGLFEEFANKKLSQIIVCGIETHVCVQQTSLDLIANNFQVNIPADAVSSRREIDYSTALARMASNGVEVTTTESILFELLENYKVTEFKEIAKLVK